MMPFNAGKTPLKTSLIQDVNLPPIMNLIALSYYSKFCILRQLLVSKKCDFHLQVVFISRSFFIHDKLSLLCITYNIRSHDISFTVQSSWLIFNHEYVQDEV